VSHNPHDCQYCQGTNCIFHGPYACGCSSAQRHTLQPRPSFHEYYTEMAKLVAKRATCIRRRVGAVVVRDNRVLATGYNGSPPGMGHCIDPDIGCLMEDGHCVRTVHAEVNAIATAARFGISVDGADVYVTWEPCRSCRNILLSAGIKTVHFSDGPNGPEQR
jgi:dCMP deaminase